MLSKIGSFGLRIINSVFKNYLVIIIILFLIVPIMIQSDCFKLGTMAKNFTKIGSPGEWMGFWGSYLGFVPALIGGYILYKWQVNRDKMLNQKQSAVADKEKIILLIEEESKITANMINQIDKTLKNQKNDKFEDEFNETTKNLFSSYQKWNNDCLNVVFKTKETLKLIKKIGTIASVGSVEDLQISLDDYNRLTEFIIKSMEENKKKMREGTSTIEEINHQDKYDRQPTINKKILFLKNLQKELLSVQAISSEASFAEKNALINFKIIN